MNQAALKSAREIAAQAVVLQIAYGQRALYSFKQHPHLIVIANNDATLDELAVAIVEIAFISKAHEIRHTQRLSELDVSSKFANLQPVSVTVQ